MLSTLPNPDTDQIIQSCQLIISSKTLSKIELETDLKQMRGQLENVIDRLNVINKRHNRITEEINEPSHQNHPESIQNFDSARTSMTQINQRRVTIKNGEETGYRMVFWKCDVMSKNCRFWAIKSQFRMI